MQVRKLNEESLTTTGINIVSCVKENDQRSIVRFVSKTTPKKVVETRMIRRVFEDRLDSLRRQWGFWTEQEKLSVQELAGGVNGATYAEASVAETGISPIMIYNALREIKKEGVNLQSKIDGLQPFESMGQMMREGFDLGELELLIVDLILALRDSLSITNNITPPQAKEAAIIITEQFAGLSIEELAMCFHKGKVGEYGEIMHRLDANVILSWLSKFSTEVEGVAVELNSQQHSQFKRVEMDGKTSDLDLMKWFKVLPKAKDASKELYGQRKMDKRAEKYFEGF